MQTVYLERVSCEVPWGFRMVGGCDYGQPIIVHKVSGGSIAWGNLMPGDMLVEVMGMPTQHMTHNQAMQAIKSAGTTLQLSLLREEEGSAPEAPPDTCHPPQTNPEEPFQTAYQPDNFDFSPVVESLEECSQVPPPPGDYCPQNLSWNTPSHENNVSPGNYHPQDSSWDTSYPEHDAPTSHHYEPTSHHQEQNEPTHPHDHHTTPTATKLPVDIFSKSSVKPFTYVTDIQAIQAQREKIKKRGLSRMVPSYQSHMGLPPDSAVVENVQFNTPLQLYSPENVVDSLQQQLAADGHQVVGLQERTPVDIQQSEVYKMVHSPEVDRPRNISFPEVRGPEKKEEETSGIDRSSIYKLSGFGRGNRGNKGVPSRSFRMLQNMTGSDDLYQEQRGRQKPVEVVPQEAESTDF